MQLFAPAAERNKELIFSLLQRSVLPARGTILEIASGTGQHVAHFAAKTPHLRWQPSDLGADARSSIDAYTRAGALDNVLNAIALDATAQTWPDLALDGIININMIHISPWAACEGLLRHASRLLPVSNSAKAGGFLFLYGPFMREDVPTAPSNLNFDASLRAQNSAWGIRHLEEVTAKAAQVGLHLEQVVPMPANNLSVVFRRS